MSYNQEIKRDGGKPEPSLVPWATIKAMARVRRYDDGRRGNKNGKGLFQLCQPISLPE